MITCTHCGRAYPETGLPFRCHRCGGVYDYDSPLMMDLSAPQTKTGIWRFDSTFDLPPGSEPVTLGEGNTPLVWAEDSDREVAFKCEFLNPTGSFKDRGSSVIASWMKARNISSAIEDSSGNAGASIAAYASRAGIEMKVYIPAGASGPKRHQIEAYGAMVVAVEGTRAQVTQAARKEADSGQVYASHAWLPFNLPGYATAAYEIVEQLNGKVPGSVIVPVGQGGLLLGLSRGFEALRVAKISQLSSKPGDPRKPVDADIPQLIGVQAKACAPLWSLIKSGQSAMETPIDTPTLAEGVRVPYPVRCEAVMQAIQTSGGTIVAVDEGDILSGRVAMAIKGFYIEPTSAIVWSALLKLRNLREPIVVMLTGSGLKYTDEKNRE